MQTAFSNLCLATLSPGGKPYGYIEDGCIVIDGNEVVWAGNRKNLPKQYDKVSHVDFKGYLVTPAFIDCHTHLVFGGNRAKEFEMRLNGASYTDIARAGGGIMKTVNATRAATVEMLVESALPRVDAMIREGVTTIEIKSGYGLDRTTELKMLRAARALADIRPINIQTTFLGAHAVPKEFSGNADDYIDDVCIPTLRESHSEGLLDAVDGFCENIAFTIEQLDRVFEVSKELGIPVKIHAEQLSRTGGTKLVARYRGLSADHIENAIDEDIEALKSSDVCAVLLPGAFYTLRERQPPPLDSLRKHGVPIAIATDCNPGTSPLTSLILTMNMACTLFGLTPEEALAGVTRNAALALGLDDRGEVRAGLRADLAVWDIKHPFELPYRIGFNPLKMRIFGGRIESV